jgi:hypothetical protein
MGKYMKLLLLISLVWVQLLPTVNAANYIDVKTDINAGLLPIEAAKNAHENDEQSADVVQQLVDTNVDVVKAVQTVAKQWSSCEDTYASVKKGVQMSPDRADEIVAAVATMSGCKCNAQSFWGRSRIEQRLRPRINRALVEISQSCSCASAGIEAAIEIVPEKAEDMIDAVIVAKNRAERTADSIGQIGVIPTQKYWGDNAVNTKDTNLTRNISVCKGDHDEMDDFVPGDTWISSDGSQALGQHKLICKEENNEKDEEEEENKDKNLIISQYIEGQGNNQALELYNGSDKAIDLVKDNYQLEVYFHGYDFPGEVIQLKGLIEPQKTFVVTNSNAGADMTSVANQKVNGLIFKGADAVVLKTGFTNKPCECGVSTVAAAMNGVDKNNSDEPISETKKDFIKRIEQHYGNTNIQTTVIDSIGRILPEDEEQDKPIVEDKTLRRMGTICKGDRIEMNEFNIQSEWQSYDVDNFSDSGKFDKQDCLASRKDLLLSEYIEGTKDNAMVEIFNGTDRPINFEEEKYLLEIYHDEDDDPDQTIYLKGEVAGNGVFVISHSDSDKDLQDMSQQTTGELDLENARAVVLKKVVLPAYQSCYADIANWVTNNDLENIIYTLTPIFDPGTGPDSDDDPRDGDDGGELASPN